MVGLLLPSDFIGRPGRSKIEFNVTATTQITLWCFNRAPFEKLVNDTPHIAQRLMELALDALDAAREWTLLLGRRTAREKIAAFAEMLARRSHITEATEFKGITLYLPREQIANYSD